MFTPRTCRTPLFLFLAFAVMLPLAMAQQGSGTIRGQVTDESGASIPATDVTISNGKGFTKTLSSNEEGIFSVSGLAPGSYTVRAARNGFATFEAKSISVSAGRTQNLNIPLKLQAATQEVTVSSEAVGTVSVDASQNAGQLVLKEADLDALPDDPDDLATDLQALAGPSAGPNGGQIYIDGFTGGSLPPKSSIREIRINQNPFSSEYDKLGFGRIEILTKPGTDKFRGSALFSDSDAFFNSRNPYSTNKPAFQSRQYEANLSGPISKKASFFLDFQRRDITDNAVVNARILDANLNEQPVQISIVAPQQRMEISPRIDYQLNANNTLVARYQHETGSSENAGVGLYSLPERAYSTTRSEDNVRITETAILGPKVVNETRFQFRRDQTGDVGDNTVPTIQVLDAFTGGGAQVGNTFNHQNLYEIQNYTSIAQGRHSMKFGVRSRTVTLDDNSPQNFGGTFLFAGGDVPVLDANNQPVLDANGKPLTQKFTSLQQYRQTILLQRQGLTAPQIRALGFGATQFSIAGGNPNAGLTQTDVGVFFQDDWRVKPNFTLSLGMRYETQTNIHDRSDFAPRLGIAWAPGSKGGKPGKTVIRGGYGLFYDRFSESLTLQTVRFNGVNQQQYILPNPTLIVPIEGTTNKDTAPSIASLGAQQRPQTIRQADSNLRAPEIMQAALGIERQLPYNTTVAVTFTNSHATHQLRTRNINAPVPGTFTPGPNAANQGFRPYGPGNLYLYESAGILNQNQLITNVRTQATRNISLFGYYVFGFAKSNTDGAGSFPANQYDLSSEYGRSSLDVRHRFVLGGSVATRFGLRWSPFIIAHSGQPFNITTGQDIYGNSVFTERPALATDCGLPTSKCTAFGDFNLAPATGQAIIPRNYAEGPSYFSVNMRVSRTWGFGESTGGRPSGGGGGDSGGHGHGGPGGMTMGGGPGGRHGGFGGDSTGRRYNVTLSLSARNLFNTVNPGPPIGNLTSPQFGESTGLASGFGPQGNAANNRRVDFQIRFSF
ncbi:MAG: TonB-dependent receptor [Acidobacteriota bacterium]|nr:TonB-dependent receptor [Acidobacteriota bacterium]